MEAALRFPNDTHRLVIVGRTGTGKTQAGVYQLSRKDFARFPWIVLDTKREDFFRDLLRFQGTHKMTFADRIPREGLHIIQPLPHEMQSDAAENFLWRVHQRQRCGLFIDEGYMMDAYSRALRAIYTQGRSLRIPTITLSQKPKYIMQPTLSEADFFQVFDLNDRKDRQRIEEFMPADLDRPLPLYHSLWYDVGRRSVDEFLPVPARQRILENFEAQLRFAKRVI